MSILTDNLKFSLNNEGIYNFISYDKVFDYKNIISLIFEKNLTNNEFIADNYIGHLRKVKYSLIKGIGRKAINYSDYGDELNLNFLNNLDENAVILDFKDVFNNSYSELYEIVKLKKLHYLIVSGSPKDCIYIKNFEIALPDKFKLVEIVRDFFKLKKINVKDNFIDNISNYLTGIPVTKVKEILNYSLYQFKENKKDFFKILVSEKKKYFKLNLSMEFIEEVENISVLGGQNALKAWLKEREKAISVEAAKKGIPFPKGLLLVGIQGCGKSLTAKSISGMWKMPLLKMDFSLLFTGDKTPEVTFKENLIMAEKLSPIILWLDEIDKLFSASSSGGVIELKRILGTFLTWLQEKISKVFVVATANKIDDIPPELLRKGRFDEIFFIDLPKEKERIEIFKIHFLKRKLNYKKFNLKLLADKTEFFSGSEIEQVIVSALYKGFSENREITEEDLFNIIEETVPFYYTYEENIKELKKWAEEKARKASFDDELFELFE